MLRFALLVVVVALLAAAAIAQQAPPPPRTISVTGTAERMVPPDTGLVVLAIETQANTVARAAAQNNTAANRVMDEIRRLNIAGLTMRTLGFDVEPIYEQPPAGRPSTTPPKIVGYRVVNRLEVRIPASGNPQGLSEKVGKVLDTALAAGANRVDSVQFTLEEEGPVMRELLAEATRNAHDMAAAMAQAAGVTLGPLMSLSATPFFPPPPGPLFARSAEAAGGVPIVAGPLTVRATVNAEYGIQ